MPTTQMLYEAPTDLVLPWTNKPTRYREQHTTGAGWWSTSQCFLQILRSAMDLVAKPLGFTVHSSNLLHETRGSPHESCLGFPSHILIPYLHNVLNIPFCPATAYLRHVQAHSNKHKIIAYY